MSRKPARVRVLVNLGAADSPLALAMPANNYLRSRRLHTLLQLGLAAEAAGLELASGTTRPLLKRLPDLATSPLTSPAPAPSAPEFTVPSALMASLIGSECQ